MDISPTSSTTMACLTIIAFEIFVGTLVNSFIAFVFLWDYCKESYGNKIRIAINRSSIIFMVVSSSALFCYIFWPDVHKKLSVFFQILLMYSMSSSLWLTALLCFYQFIKIVQFQCEALSWIQKKVNSVVLWLLIAIEVWSLGYSFLGLFFFSGMQKPLTNSSDLTTFNGHFGGSSTHLTVVFIIGVMFFIPYSSIVVTIILAAGSLRHHTKIMKTMNTSGDGNVKVYTNTVYRMICFLVLYTSFYIVVFLVYFSLFGSQIPWFWTGMIFIFFYPSAHSLILILGNTKLKTAWRMMFDFSMFCAQTRNH